MKNMNRVITVMVVVISLMATQSLIFATEQKADVNSEESKTNKQVESIIPMQPKIKLSLDEAIKIMTTTGTRAESAELNKKKDKAVEEGYDEQYSDIKKGLDATTLYRPQVIAIGAAKVKKKNPGLTDQQAAAAFEQSAAFSEAMFNITVSAQAAGATLNNKNIVNKRRSFAKNNSKNNYEADINQIKQDTIAIYSGVVLAEENYRISQDSLRVQGENLKNIELKYKVGLLAKKDVLEAKSSVEKAKTALRQAENKMKMAKMQLNFLLGYNVMQEVELTDRLTKEQAEIAPVETAIENALKNRNEIKGADLGKDIYNLILNEYRAYPRFSSKYLTAKNNLLVAEKTAKDARSQIEIDVRMRKDTLDEKTDALESAKAIQAYAKEGERLMKLTHEEGLSTVQELLDVEVKLYQANLNMANAISEYNSALRAYVDAQGVGTMRIPLQETREIISVMNIYYK